MALERQTVFQSITIEAGGIAFGQFLLGVFDTNANGWATEPSPYRIPVAGGEEVAQRIAASSDALAALGFPAIADDDAATIAAHVALSRK